MRVQGWSTIWNCNPGKYLSYGHCVSCPEGTYKSTYGISINYCVSCPKGKTSPAGSTINYNCDKCDSGYEGEPGYFSTCTRCSAGKYYDKAFRIEDPTDNYCRNCPEGKYAEKQGQSKCDDCPVRSTSPEKSTSVYNCQCNAGAQKVDPVFQTGHPFACQSCPVGKYKDLIGDGACLNCIDPKGNAMTTANLGSTSSSDCLCMAGYEGSIIDGCWACSQGTYSSAPGDHCNSCPLANQWSGTAATQCACNAGYEPRDGQCGFCVIGKYKPTIADEPCTQCGPNQVTFVPGGGVATSRQYCECQSGYTSPTTSPDSLCSACPRGKYQIFSLSGQACQDCSVGGTTVTTASAYDWNCIADAGYYEVSRNSFLPCPVGTYRAYTAYEDADHSIASCLACPYRTTSVQASTSQNDCNCSTPEHVEGKPPCVCASGYYLNSTDQCEICDAGVYCFGETIYDCPEQSISPEGSGSVGDCECVGGWLNSSNQCESCDEYSYYFNNVCNSCPPNMRAPPFSTDGLSQCVAAPGYYMQDGVAVQCPMGSTSLGGGDSFADCTALPGFYNDGSEIRQCVSHANSSAGSTSIAECLCLPGYAGFAGSGEACEACAGGYFKPEWGDGSCTACHVNSGTETLNSTTESQCLCLPGYHAAIGSTECIPCEIGKFKEDLSNTEICDSCGDFRIFSTTQQSASASSADCLCDRGRFLENGLCEACGWGFYKEYVGNSVCRSCSYGHSTVSSVSTSPDDCVCGQGFQAVDAS